MWINCAYIIITLLVKFCIGNRWGSTRRPVNLIHTISSWGLLGTQYIGPLQDGQLNMGVRERLVLNVKRRRGTHPSGAKWRSGRGGAALGWEPRAAPAARAPSWLERLLQLCNNNNNSIMYVTKICSCRQETHCSCEIDCSLSCWQKPYCKC